MPLSFSKAAQSAFHVLLDLKIFAACDDLWGGPPGPRPTPPSARFWLRLGCSVGRSPWTAADALVGLLGAEERVQGDPRGPGGPPHLALRTDCYGTS
jgi:hypothetical protein